MTREALLAEVMRLPAEERRALALEVLGSSPDQAMQTEVDASHRAELDRRMQLSDAGQLHYSPWPEARARIFGHDG